MKTVALFSTTKLPCVCNTSPTVVLCLSSSDLLAPRLCPDSEAEETFPFSTIEGTLVSSYLNTSTCEASCQRPTSTWRYIVTYDETLLADPTVLLTADDITGIFCKDCRSTWTEELVGNEPTLVENEDGTLTFTSPHGCQTTFSPGEGALSVLDTDTVDLTFSAEKVLSADVKISDDATNALGVLADGLYVPELTVEDSDSVTLATVGSAPPVLSAEVVVSPTSDNLLQSTVVGLYVPALTVTDSSTIDFTASGTTPENITGEVKISADAGNIISASADGIFASAPSAVPTGAILPYGGSSAPTGYLLADGTAVSRTTYSDLFAAIGTAYGVGNGVTTFNLPDLRGRFPLGKATAGTGANLGDTGGSLDHTHTGPSHTHSVPAHYHGMGTGADLNITASGSHNHQYNINTAGAYATPKALIGGADGGVTASFTDTNTHTHASGDFSGRIGLVTGGVDGNAAMTSGASGTGNTGTANPAFQTVNYIIKT